MKRMAAKVAPDSVREFKTNREAAPLNRVRFQFYDSEAGTDVARRNLPHWEQPDVCYFVTFRLVDSLPAAVRNEWSERRRDWLKAHKIDITDSVWRAAFEALPKTQRDEYHRIFSQAMHGLLDACYGECPLKSAEVRGIVTRSLHHFDGERYLLGGYVVMPNHVHVLVQFLGEHTLSKTCYSWKHFTAHEILKTLGRTGEGRLWQDESFDHIVRSPEQFQKYRSYFAENPVKARLDETAFSLYLPDVDYLTMQ
jgi:putative transposase